MTGTTIKASGVELLVRPPSPAILAEAGAVRDRAVAEAKASGLPTPELAEVCSWWAGHWASVLHIVSMSVYVARTGALFFSSPDDVEQERHHEASYEAVKALAPWLEDEG